MISLVRKILSKIQPRIFYVFLFATVTVILFIRLISINNEGTLSTDLMVKGTYELIKDVETIKSSVSETEAAERAFLLTGRDHWEKVLETSQQNTRKALHEAMAQTNDALQATRLEVLENAINSKFAYENDLVKNKKYLGNEKDKERYDEQARKIGLNIQAMLEQYMLRQNELLLERTEASSRSKTRALTTAILGMGLFFLFITATLVRLNRDIRRRVNAEKGIRNSERKYRRLIEDAGVTMFTSNHQGIFTYVSGRAFTLTGFTVEELTGKSFATLVAPDWIEQVAAQYQQQVANSISESTVEFPIITKDGQRKWVEQQAVLLFDDGGRFSGYQCVVKDITDKKEADIQLKQSEQLMQSVLNNTREGFFMINKNCELLLVNKQAREGMEMLSGKKLEVGMNLMDFVLASEIDQARENLSRVFSGEQVNYESRYDTPLGPQWIRISHSPVRDNNGEIIGAALVTHDVTEKRRQEEKLRDSDQKIRAMLESTKEGFFMIGRDYRFMMMNEVGRKNIESITGKSSNIGDSVLDFVLPGRKNLFLSIFQRVMDGATEETEVSVKTPEGEKWLQTSYFPVRSADNAIIGICTSSKDITEKKLVDNALAKIRAEREEYQYRLQSILDNTPLIVFVKDLEGRYLFVNKSFLELLNLGDRDVIGKTDFEFTSQDLATQYKKVDDRVISSLRSIESEETINREGMLQNLLLTKFPLFDRKNNIYGIGGIATDYTDKVQSRQKLIEAKKKAELAEQLQEQFLANMSHEIRTPMNGIIGMTNILLGTELDDDQKEFVSIIRQSSDNLLFLINDILDLSKIKSGKLSLEQIEFNLKETLDTTLAPFAIKAKEKSLSLMLMQDASIPQSLLGDPYRLNQILNNLLSNSLKFTEKGTIRISVTSSAKTGSEITLRFSVEDSGIGIPSDKLENIFNSFEQASSSITRKFGGTGLGLAITKKLVEMQGGTIDVTSSPGSGTAFHVTITYPYINEPTNKLQKSENIHPNSGELKGKRILVAEDNEINQKVIFNILKKEGIEAVITDNGREAVNRLELGEQFDLVILDLQMPEMDGFQTAVYIRKKLHLSMPVIAMTASALRNEKTKCFEMGMNEYITKPFSPAELFQRLRSLLQTNITDSQNPDRMGDKRDNELYDLSYLLQLEDHEYFCEILQLVLDSTPLALEELKESVLYENWPQVHKQAHKMKSSLGVVQMKGMLEIVGSIEISAKQETDTEQISGKVKQATELFGLIRPILETELNNARTYGLN